MKLKTYTQMHVYTSPFIALIEQDGSFQRFLLTAPQSITRCGIPLMLITFDPRDGLHC